jgi:hypothetical protein
MTHRASVGPAVPGRPMRFLVAEDHSAGGVRTRQGADASVRTGSMAHRNIGGTIGHQRHQRPREPAGRWASNSSSSQDAS